MTRFLDACSLVLRQDVVTREIPGAGRASCPTGGGAEDGGQGVEAGDEVHHGAEWVRRQLRPLAVLAGGRVGAHCGACRGTGAVAAADTGGALAAAGCPGAQGHAAVHDGGAG